MRAGRRAGTALPGIADEAWLANRNRTTIVRAGALTAKITLAGTGNSSPAETGHPGLLAELAQLVAARLADHRAPESSRSSPG